MPFKVRIYASHTSCLSFSPKTVELEAYLSLLAQILQLELKKEKLCKSKTHSHPGMAELLMLVSPGHPWKVTIWTCKLHTTPTGTTGKVNDVTNYKLGYQLLLLSFIAWQCALKLLRGFRISNRDSVVDPEFLL